MRKRLRILSLVMVGSLIIQSVEVSAFKRTASESKMESRITESEEQSREILEDETTNSNITILYSGVSGELSWSIDSERVLTITGDGDYNWREWVLYSDYINSAVISVTGITDTSDMFRDCHNLESIDLRELDTSNVTDMENMFSECESLTDLDLSNFDTSSVTDMRNMFLECKSLTGLDLSNFDTSGVIDMCQMFFNCESLTDLEVSNFDTGSVIDMSSMFTGCSSLTKIDVSHFDTKKVTDMGQMFAHCESLARLDLSNFDTSKVADMSRMFAYCKSLARLDLSNFDTSKVADMSGMFAYCESLVSLDMSSFDTSEVKDMHWMFTECSSLTKIDVSHFDTKKVIDMNWMFYKCGNLSDINVRNFDTSNVTKMGLMFAACDKLTRMDMSNFDVSNVTDMGAIFSNCSNLKEINTPKNLHISVYIHYYGYYCDSENNVYSYLPLDLPYSITITREVENSKKVAIPKADKGGGIYNTVQGISITSATPNVNIYYTIDGTAPSATNGILYTGTFTILDSMTIKAIAIKEGMEDSDVMSEKYTFEKTTETLDLPGISMGADKKATIDDRNVTKFFPGTYEAKHAVVPISAKKTVKNDGSYKLKVAVGIGREDILNKDTEWNKYKKNIDDFKKSAAKINDLQKQLENKGACKVSPLDISKFSKKPELSVLGYYECEIDKNGNMIKQSGNVQCDAKWKGSLKWQFLTAVGPLYINLEGSGKVTGEMGVEYNAKKNSISGKGKLKLEPKIEVEGGYGINKVATIGATGSAKVPIDLLPSSKGEFQATAGIRAYLLFVFDLKYELPPYKKALWGDTNSGNVWLASSASNASDDIGHTAYSIQLIDRSYTTQTSSWQMDSIQSNLSREGLDLSNEKNNETVTETILQTGIMPQSLPMVVNAGEDSVMIFQKDSAGRETLDSAMLCYSVKENDEWSVPKPVWDTGTLDTYADLKVIDNEIYLVWQKEKEIISGNLEDVDSLLTEMAQKSEICFAKFDSNSKEFTNVQYVTDSTQANMMPKLAEVNGKPCVTWITNSANDFLQAEGTNTIFYKTWDGGNLSTTQTIRTDLGEIAEYVPFDYNDSLSVAYTSEISEEGSNQLILVEKDSIKVLSEKAFASGLQYQDNTISYLENGELIRYSMYTAESKKFMAGENVFGVNARMHNNGERTTVLFSAKNQEDGYSVYSSVLTEDGYSEPVTIYQTDNIISYLDGVLLTDGSWQLIMNQYNEDNDLHSLIYVDKPTGENIESLVFGAVEVESEEGLTPIEYLITNMSEENITKLIITVKDNEGGEIQKEVFVSIAPGETCLLTEELDLSMFSESSEVQVSIRSENQSDEGEVWTIEIGHTDLELEAAMLENEEEVCIVVTARNISNTSADGVELALYKDVEEKEPLTNISLGTLGVEGETVHTFQINKNDLIFNENDAAYISIRAVSATNDINEDNNVAVKVVYKSTEDTGGDGDNGDNGNNANNDNNDENTQDTLSVKVNKISISGVSKKIAAGKKLSLSTKVQPSNASNKAITWKSSNNKYATVNTKGVVTTKKAGAGKTVTITAMAKGGSGIKATYRIKIMKHAVKSISIKNAKKTLKPSKTMKLSAMVKTTGKNVNKKIMWTSSNKKYATVNSSGKVTAKKTGKGKTVTITAKSTDGTNKKAKIKIKIK